MTINVGQEIIDYLADSVDEDTFWGWFDAYVEEYYEMVEDPSQDECSDWYCNICHMMVVKVEDKIDNDDAYELIRKHIFEKHSYALMMKALKENL